MLTTEELEGYSMLVCYVQMLDTPEEKIRFEQIYTKYRGMMYCIANSILKNDQDAEDAVHNAFIFPSFKVLR